MHPLFRVAADAAGHRDGIDGVLKDFTTRPLVSVKAVRHPSTSSNTFPYIWMCFSTSTERHHAAGVFSTASGQLYAFTAAAHITGAGRTEAVTRYVFSYGIHSCLILVIAAFIIIPTFSAGVCDQFCFTHTCCAEEDEPNQYWVSLVLSTSNGFS